MGSSTFAIRTIRKGGGGGVPKKMRGRGIEGLRGKREIILASQWFGRSEGARKKINCHF